MNSFLEKTAQYLKNTYGNQLHELCVVLPGKRGSLYLKKHIAECYGKALILPRFCSAEELILEISELEQVDELILLAELFESYTLIETEKKESFESFVKWGTQILHDFNEIDRHLANANDLYSNVTDAKHIEMWNPEGTPPGEFQQQYIRFIETMKPLYNNFTKKLLSENKAYQGLIYREASKKTESWCKKMHYKKIVFCGFSALNKAEEKIIDILNQNNFADFLWDIDNYYLKNKFQEAGKFMRDYQGKKWFGKNGFVENNLITEKKEIEIISAAKNMGQIFAASQVLKQWQEKEIINQSAVILADEKLLFPALTALPSQINSYNVTLEYPIKHSHIFGLLDAFFHLHKQRIKSGGRGYYLNDLITVFLNPIMGFVLQSNKNNNIISKLNASNYSYFTEKELLDIINNQIPGADIIFTNWENDEITDKSLFALLNCIRESNMQNHPGLQTEVEFLFHIYKRCNQMQKLRSKFSFLSGVDNTEALLMHLLRNESLPFIGEPLSGLQIMGVLETRTLDFENIIVLSVNEGILPSGKTQNSFIPNDIKKAFELPLYSDKDAIYAYHFYRLMQRAKKITFIYNSESDLTGSGEKSRFLQQLELELPKINSNVSITNRSFTLTRQNPEPENILNFKVSEKEINKYINYLNDEKSVGLSPSAINTFLDCKLKFYYKYYLRIKEPVEAEEEIESGTLGSIMHYALEKIFENAKGIELTEKYLNEVSKNIEELLNQAFLEFYSKKAVSRGKNLLARKMASKFLNNLINFEKAELKKGHTTQILETEKNLQTFLHLKNIKIKVGGKSDRIDLYNGKTRVLDYKSKIYKDDRFIVGNISDLFEKQKLHKAFQVMYYAWILYKNKVASPEKIDSVLVPLQKSEKSSYHLLVSKNEKLIYNHVLFEEFEQELMKTVQKMLSIETDFCATETLKTCTYCPYSPICRR